MQTAIATDCMLTCLPNGIYVFTFVQPSRRSVDEWLAHLDWIFARTPSDQKVRYIMDYRGKGLPPISYGVQRSRQWLRENPYHNLARVAFLYKSGALISMLDSMIRYLNANRVTLRFFQQEDEAVDWLLAD
ncbi:MAG: hypothetical protein H7Y09_10845 [Chitinophagaceae bacterium]|nr:hypothetical protein [Anaerolineae bacterium]